MGARRGQLQDLTMTMRLGLIGRGRWGQIIARTLDGLRDITVVPIIRGEAQPRDIDGVIVATQSVTHAEVALPYIEAGLPVFIEKPLTTSVADAARIADAAQKSGAPVFVGHIHLYNPAFQTALELRDKVGPVRVMLCEAANERPRTDSSVFWEWLPHPLALARAFLGRDPDHVEAWGLIGAAAAQSAVARYDFGPTPAIMTINRVSPVMVFRATIAGERGTLVFDDRAERKLVLHHGLGAVTTPSYDDEPPLTRELRAFVKVVETGRLDGPHLDMAQAIVRAIAAAEESAARGGTRRPIAV
jgi:predicted dehydrogenase